MKKIIHLLMAIAAMSSFGFAGGDFKDVEPVVVVPVIPEVDHSGFYAGASVAYQRTYGTDSKWFGKTDSQDETGGLGLVGGYTLNEYIGVEARFSGSVMEEDYAKVTTYSIFAKPQYPVTEDFTLYALLGYGNVTVDATDEGGWYFGAVSRIVGDTLMDESGFQWGLGMSYAMTEEFDLFFDYISFANDADIDPTPLFAYSPGTIYRELSNDALTLGVNYKF